MPTDAPKIIFLTQNPDRAQPAIDVFQSNGLVIEEVCSIDTFVEDTDTHAEAVFADIDENSFDDLELLTHLFEVSPIPIVFYDTSTWDNSERWGRRIAAKLVAAIDEARLEKDLNVAVVEAQTKALAEPKKVAVVHPFPLHAVPSTKLAKNKNQRVWVLGASLGGPEVVKKFFLALNGRPKICLIVAQHIGEGFAELMANQLNRCTDMDVVVAEHGQAIEDGKVMVVPVEARFSITVDGKIELSQEDRPRMYKPCIDYVMQEVAERYGQQSGAIVFSGMGDDGAAGSVVIHEAGGVVWAQSAETCVISSMPDCARKTGVVEQTGAPEEMAESLIDFLSRPRPSRNNTVELRPR